MDWPSVLPWVSIGISLLGVGLTVRSYRRAYPRRSLGYTLTSHPLETLTSHGRTQLKVGKRSVPTPHLIVFSLQSTSRASIHSQLFDDKRPLVFRFEVKEAVRENGTPRGQVFGEVKASPKVITLEIPPQLIRPRSAVEVTFLADALPELSIEETLIDIPVRDALIAPFGPEFPTPGMLLMFAVPPFLLAVILSEPAELGFHIAFYASILIAVVTWGHYWTEVVRYRAQQRRIMESAQQANPLRRNA